MQRKVFLLFIAILPVISCQYNPSVVSSPSTKVSNLVSVSPSKSIVPSSSVSTNPTPSITPTPSPTVTPVINPAKDAFPNDYQQIDYLAPYNPYLVLPDDVTKVLLKKLQASEMYGYIYDRNNNIINNAVLTTVIYKAELSNSIQELKNYYDENPDYNLYLKNTAITNTHGLYEIVLPYSTDNTLIVSKSGFTKRVITKDSSNGTYNFPMDFSKNFSINNEPEIWDIKINTQEVRNINRTGFDLNKMYSVYLKKKFTKFRIPSKLILSIYCKKRCRLFKI